MQLLRPLLVFALLGFGLIYWLLGPAGGLGAIGGFILFWLMLGLGYGYWLGLDHRADKMVSELMQWKSKRSRGPSAAESRAD